jgi:hypothetical protein
MSWSNVCAHISGQAHDLSIALEGLPFDAPLDTLIISGKPGEACWGGAPAAAANIFHTLTESDVDILMSAIQIQGLLPGLRFLKMTSHLSFGDGAARSLSK